jgi:hypothetical protein
MIKLKIVLDELTDDEAWAVAQMCKGMIWDDFRRLSPAERSAMTWTARPSSCGERLLGRI